LYCPIDEPFRLSRWENAIRVAEVMLEVNSDECFASSELRQGRGIEEKHYEIITPSYHGG
jgi:hypothetical protein